MAGACRNGQFLLTGSLQDKVEQEQQQQEDSYGLLPDAKSAELMAAYRARCCFFVNAHRTRRAGLFSHCRVLLYNTTNIRIAYPLQQR